MLLWMDQVSCSFSPTSRIRMLVKTITECLCLPVKSLQSLKHYKDSRSTFPTWANTRKRTPMFKGSKAMAEGAASMSSTSQLATSASRPWNKEPYSRVLRLSMISYWPPLALLWARFWRTLNRRSKFSFHSPTGPPSLTPTSSSLTATICPHSMSASRPPLIYRHR